MDSQQYISEYATTSHQQVLRFFASHSIDHQGKADFYDEYGVHSEYKSSDVLGWMGY